MVSWQTGRTIRAGDLRALSGQQVARFEWFLFPANGGVRVLLSAIPACQHTPPNGTAYAWDTKGNLLSDGVSVYSYDTANQVMSVDQGSNTFTFAYSGLGDRLRQTVNGTPTTYTLDLAGGLTQVLADGTNTYLYGLGRIGEQQPGGWQYHLGDALGSVRQLADANGAVRLARAYEPFGETLTSVGSGATAYGYTGEWADAKGLVHLRARYYAPGQGRFVTRDEWEDDRTRPLSLNQWAYVEEDPVSRVDPSGLSPYEDLIKGYYEIFYRVGVVQKEFRIRGGSRTGLEYLPVPNGLKLAGNSTGNIGRVDIVDTLFSGVGLAYEIEPEQQFAKALAEIEWYIEVYNANPNPPPDPWRLVPGGSFSRDWIFVGITGDLAIEAKLPVEGVIVWRKVANPPLPLPLPARVPERNRVKRPIPGSVPVPVPGLGSFCPNLFFDWSVLEP